MDPYATHQPYLLGLVARTHGAVLELGAGDYSTPQLHSMCAPGPAPFGARRLVTVESNAAWLDRYRRLAAPWHALHLTKSWEDVAEVENPHAFFSVAFIDHAPAGRRPVDVARLRAKVRFFVLHDTDPQVWAEYGWAAVVPTFRFRKDFKDFGPHTTVVSDIEEIPAL